MLEKSGYLRRWFGHLQPYPAEHTLDPPVVRSGAEGCELNDSNSLHHCFREPVTALVSCQRLGSTNNRAPVSGVRTVLLAASRDGAPNVP